jgi:hypothetical protein
MTLGLREESVRPEARFGSIRAIRIQQPVAAGAPKPIPLPAESPCLLPAESPRLAR